MSTGDRPIRRALLSVSDKTGLAGLARELVRHGVELISTGGTARALRDSGHKVRDVSELTGFPEMMDGRIKTLHPLVHGGLLAIRGHAGHERAMTEHGIAPIDLLVVNLYPFEAALDRGAGFAECVENIDVGGPAMIRGAAKNHAGVTVVVDPGDYGALIAEMDRAHGATSPEFRKVMAAKAFARTAVYDAAIAGWFAGEADLVPPPVFLLAGTLKQTLRYGENPHQWAALYAGGERQLGVATARQVQGKELSYNNLNDTDAAFELAAEFDRGMPGVAIIKHANPCGAAMGATLAEAYRKALKCDPVSAFGGIVAVNRPLDEGIAREIAKVFTEVVIAPGAGARALEILAGKASLRVLLTDGLPDPRRPGMAAKPIAGGLLVQSRDNGSVTERELRVVTQRQPTAGELADMLFAFKLAKHVKSNAIVYVKDGATVGLGAGQMSRVDAARIAAWKAAEAAKTAGEAEPLTRGSVVASDAFFPFADGLITAAEAGATAVIQPGGSVRDDEVIAAADARDLAMVFTGIRHFRH